MDWSAAACWASSPPALWSSASTSECSTAPSPSGFPGSVSSLRQQWGRAGRRGHGLGLLIAGSDALDQYFARHADELLDRSPECAVSNPGNPAVLAGHLRCAAAELPLTAADAAEFGADGLELAASLARADPDSRRARLPGSRPSRRPGLAALGGRGRGRRGRSESPGRWLASSTAPAPTPPSTRALSTCTWACSTWCTATDPGARIAFVEPFTGDYYTQAVSRSQTEIVRELETRSVAGARVAFGEIEVREQVLGYQRKRLSDHKPIDQFPLERPSAGSRPKRSGSCPRPRPPASRRLWARCTQPSTR